MDQRNDWTGLSLVYPPSGYQREPGDGCQPHPERYRTGATVFSLTKTRLSRKLRAAPVRKGFVRLGQSYN